MASQVTASKEQTKPLEEGVANLSLQEKTAVIADAVNEYVDGVKEAAKISAEDVKGELNGSVEETKDNQAQPLEEVAFDTEKGSQEHQEQPLQDSNSREVDIAEKEAQKSPDEGAYVVPTVDHRSVQGPEGEEKMEVATGVVHENADPIDKPLQDCNSREVDIAEKEAQKSPDNGAYVVPTVDHRSVQGPGGEEKMEVATGVVHENADPIDKPQQQGKGLIQSITHSVKSVFSGLTGGKGVKGSEIKTEETK